MTLSTAANTSCSPLLWPDWSPEILSNSPSHILVVRVPLEISPGRQTQLRELLSTSELARADRYRFPEVGRRFIACRAALKTLLAMHMQGCHQPKDIRSIELIPTASGKPTWAGSQSDFSVSHSGEMALIALQLPCSTSTTDHSPAPLRLGIDLEHAARTTDCLRLARRFFAPGEVAALEALPAEEVQRAFFRCWTRKEAYVKAIGVGLAYSLEAFEVPIDPLPPGTSHRALLSHAADVQQVQRWQLFETSPHPQYEAALFLDSPHPPNITYATINWAQTSIL
ncbi:4'-phosphopantetheinyl transferase [Planctopirus limnophila DSM 3776]|uniref:4'-phosphopantetheinyl transferase n=1 Tax=Planctopirus limnophila (strain ATCC 43296 / DSM 3776 / IFAM 1008 / Mu 290) TaxID=521674 RepID=D5SS82_PLAL2|nr:4'-phosphopantetheinyl transferase superfamily protein [Planctopirus limnophila]ADG68806.1 4'-phosphopantetheinyl transferase [Planctopirus limnophila DSM 3776]